MTKLILTDIHGCYDEMIELIDRAKADEVYICGDLIDRGPDSEKVVQYVIDNNIKCILGNHELMAIDTITEYNPSKPYSKMWLHGTDWFQNGGKEVFENYSSLDKLKEHVEFFKTLPIYRLLDDMTNNKQILLSHSMITQYVKDIEEPIGPSFNDIDDQCVPFVWNRLTNAPKSKYFNIFGHSPTDWFAKLDKQPVLTDKIANLDTGCAYKKIPTRGVLTGLILPSMEIIQTKKD